MGREGLVTKPNFYLVKSVIVGALGGLLFGFDTAVIAGSLRSLRALFALSPLQVGFTVSIALVGTVIGSVISGSLGERLGGGIAMVRIGWRLHAVTLAGLQPDCQPRLM